MSTKRPETFERVPFVRSCLEETATPVQADVKGQVPLWLNGTLIRNGPGLMKVGNDQYKHIFDGLALLHRLSINNGQVEYQSKFLRSDSYKRNTNANRIVVSEFGTHAYPDPCKSILGRFMSFFEKPIRTDNDNVNIYPINDQIYAATETFYIHRIDPKDLSTFEKVDLSKYLTINTATAHPHVDEDKNVYNVGSSFGAKGKYHIFKTPSTDKAFEEIKILSSIEMSHKLSPSYYHSFLMTENYIIFIEQSLVVSVPVISRSCITKETFADSLRWMPERRTKFHLIKKSTGEVIPTKYVSDALLFFHTINAYEDDNHVVVDLCCYPTGDLVRDLYANAIRKERSEGNFPFKTASARRYVLPLLTDAQKDKSDSNIVKLNYTSATATIEPDSSVFLKCEMLTQSGGGELPRINYEKFNGKKYRYFYSLVGRESDGLTQLMKFDINTKEFKIWSEEDYSPSEPVFVLRPGYENDSEEDDGVVLSLVLSEVEETKGFLLILDAKNFKEIARAAFEAKSALTGTFHGLFISDK